LITIFRLIVFRNVLAILLEDISAKRLFFAKNKKKPTKITRSSPTGVTVYAFRVLLHGRGVGPVRIAAATRFGRQTAQQRSGGQRLRLHERYGADIDSNDERYSRESRTRVH